MTDAELLAIIAQAEREGWTELDLSRKGIKEIPLKIAQLSNLTMLFLSNNQITAIPDAITYLLDHLNNWQKINVISPFPMIS